MKRVLIVSKSGREKLVKRRDAKLLVEKIGSHFYADDAPAPVAPASRQARAPRTDDYDDMSYTELRTLVAGRDLEPEGRKKEDLIAALRSAGRYQRRDLRAEE